MLFELVSDDLLPLKKTKIKKIKFTNKIKNFGLMKMGAGLYNYSLRKLMSL